MLQRQIWHRPYIYEHLFLRSNYKLYTIIKSYIYIYIRITITYIYIIYLVVKTSSYYPPLHFSIISSLSILFFPFLHFCMYFLFSQSLFLKCFSLATLSWSTSSPFVGPLLQLQKTIPCLCLCLSPSLLPKASSYCFGMFSSIIMRLQGCRPKQEVRGRLHE